MGTRSVRVWRGRIPSELLKPQPYTIDVSKAPMTRAEFVEFVRAAKLGVVATVDAVGHPEAALVDLAVTDHGEVLFDTKAVARKVVNIGGNQRVALVVGWADRVSVQAEGDAEVLWGAEREKDRRIHQEQLPKLPVASPREQIGNLRHRWGVPEAMGSSW